MALFALMERAGHAAAETVARFTVNREILVLCGPGNNGGDGYVCAAGLAARGLHVRVARIGLPQSEQAQAAAAGWEGPLEPLAAARPAPVLVDALFGIGLNRPLDPAYAEPLAHLAAAARTVIALDLPSGVEADSGALLGTVPHAHLTVAFGALKPAHLLEPAASRCGRVVLADIGLDISAALTWANAAPGPRADSPEIHKYARGHVLVLGGGVARGGAARLAAWGAARAGAGLVTVCVPPDAIAENTARLDSIMLREIAHPRALAGLVEERRASVVVLGPGLGTHVAAAEMLEAALALPIPLVLDADVFTLLAASPHRLRRAPATILTPHEGEFRRLMGDVPGSKLDRARAAAAATGTVVVLKGPDTVIATPDGQARLNHAPAPALATAGSGDVLAGAIAGRLAGRSPAHAAAALVAASEAVWAHGEAGRRAPAGLVAEDLPQMLAAMLGRAC